LFESKTETIKNILGLILLAVIFISLLFIFSLEEDRKIILQSKKNLILQQRILEKKKENQEIEKRIEKLKQENAIRSKKATPVMRGVASYYSDYFDGKRTASMEVFSNAQYTAACLCPKYFGKKVYVKYTGGNKKIKNKIIVVKINDRGPYVKGRVIDLSQKSFLAISPEGLKTGLISVVIWSAPDNAKLGPVVH